MVGTDETIPSVVFRLENDSVHVKIDSVRMKIYVACVNVRIAIVRSSDAHT